MIPGQYKLGLGSALRDQDEGERRREVGIRIRVRVRSGCARLFRQRDAARDVEAVLVRLSIISFFIVGVDDEVAKVLSVIGLGLGLALVVADDAPSPVQRLVRRRGDVRVARPCRRADQVLLLALRLLERLHRSGAQGTRPRTRARACAAEGNALQSTMAHRGVSSGLRLEKFGWNNVCRVLLCGGSLAAKPSRQASFARSVGRTEDFIVPQAWCRIEMKR
eukprot:6189323-Pleurochrysis_carterae.AAC.3